MEGKQIFDDRLVLLKDDFMGFITTLLAICIYVAVKKYNNK